MLPISAKELHRFTPQACEGMERPPVYLIAVPTVFTRPLYERKLAELAYPPPDREFRREIDAAIREVVAADQREELLAVNSGYWDSYEAALRDSPADAASFETPTEYRQLVAAVMPHWEPLRRLEAARQFYMSMVPVIACQHFLKGAENADAELRFEGGVLSPESLAALDPAHVELVGWMALSLSRLTEAQRKNSASPSPSGSTPASSTARTKPPKAATGKSAARPTRKTPRDS